MVKKKITHGSAQGEDHVVAAKPPNGKAVLVVEDEDAMGKVLCNKFDRQGFTTKRATNGVDAIEIMKGAKFDLILLDLLMPGKDGFGVLLEKGDTMNAKTPTFVLTNLGEEDVLKRARDMGAAECFTKANTSLNDLVTRVKKELGV